MRVGYVQPVMVNVQECVRRDQGGALIALGKRMILGDAEK